MTQDQDNIRTMFQTTIQFLDNNNSIWSGTTAFADAVTRAKSGLDALDTAVDTQQTPTTGVAGDKAQARDDLEDKILALADQVAALAAKGAKHDLAAQVQMTKSSLDQMPDSDLEDTAERVGAAATANMADLAAYGVTAADVTALNTARTTFAGMKTSPRQAAVVRKAQTESIPQLIRNVRSIFRNEIDKMMTPYKKTNTDFYNGYFAARVIVNRPGTFPGPNPVEPPPPPPNP
jgi:hypothetical protein